MKKERYIHAYLIHGDITMSKVNDADNEKANDIGKYETDIREETVRIKSRQVMMSDRKKPTEIMKMKADHHRLEAVYTKI